MNKFNKHVASSIHLDTEFPPNATFISPLYVVSRFVLPCLIGEVVINLTCNSKMNLHMERMGTIAYASTTVGRAPNSYQ